MTSDNTNSTEGITLWTVPAGPATWIMEPGNGPVGGPLAVTVSDLRAFLDTLTAAGLTVSLSRFPRSETVSYVHADRGDVSLTFRRPNPGEIRPAADPTIRVGYPARVLPADPDSSKHSGRGRYQGSTGIVMRRGADGWAGEGQPGTERWGVRLDNATSEPHGRDRIVYFRASDLELTGEVSQDNSDPYPCGNCHGRGRTQLAPLDPCLRCGGNGVDPYVNASADDSAEPHEHHFPLPPNADTDPAMEPGDCECGTTFTEYVAQRAADQEPFTLDEAARLGGVERLTGGAITGPYFEVEDDEEDD